MIMSAEIAALLEPGYLTGVEDLSLGELRQRRTACSGVEVGLSYLRRLVQGRLDIVLAEVHRREAGAEPLDLAALVAQLPHILSDHLHAPGPGRLPMLLAPDELDLGGTDRLDRIVSADRLGRLSEVADDQLVAIAEHLDAFEREVSNERRALHDVMDRLQEEVVRRYKTGEATVDTLLR
jgi:hypothetical protein